MDRIFNTALDLVTVLTGLPDPRRATGVIAELVDLFDGEPEKQEALKSRAEQKFADAGAALDRLDAAIAEAKARR